MGPSEGISPVGAGLDMPGQQERTMQSRACRLLVGVLCLALMAIGVGAVTAPSAQAVTGVTFDDGTHTWTFDTFGTPETASITACAMSGVGGDCSGAVTIPSSVTDVGAVPPVTYTVTEVGGFIYNTSMTSVSIPNSVTSITSYAFYGTGLTSVSFGTGVTSIGTAAFATTALTSVVVPSGVTTLPDSVFSGTSSLTSVTLPAGLVTIDWNAFRDSGLTSVTIPNSVTTINPNAFMDALSLTSVTFGSGITSVGLNAFSGTPVTSVVIAPGTTSFDASWFSGMTALSTVSIPSSVTAIPDDAFNGQPLTTVTLPSGLVSIGARAFQGTSIPSVQIPSTVTSIGNEAFYLTFLLSSITFKGAPPASVGTNIFYLAPATKILIPRGAGWPAPPAPFGGIPTEYATPAPPAPPAPPGPAPAPAVTSTPSPTPATAAIPAPVEDLAPVTTAVGGEVPPGAVRPGGSMLLVGGQPAPVVVAPAAGPKPTAVLASGPGFTASFGGVGPDGARLALGASGALVVQSEQQARSGTPLRARALAAVNRARPATGSDTSTGAPVVAAAGEGFLAGSTIRFYVLPDALMGDLIADAAGGFAGNVPVPAGIAPGARVLQMNGYAPDGSVRSLSIGILATPKGVEAAVSRKQATVFFEPLSARITAQGMAVLRSLVTATGPDATMTRVVGFVRATGATDNDDSLSMARAASVKAALRSLGLRGPIEVLGEGVALQPGHAARRATATIYYRSASPS